MSDDDVTNKRGIYSFVLSRNEKHLNIRAFTANQKREAYEKQKGICPDCAEQKRWDIKEMEGDHITPWHLGGKTVADNCQLLCMEHNRRKSGK
jgi:5-methylcytosine-specific restriction endonuclease McrA